MKRARFGVFVVIVFCVGLILWPAQTTADSSVRVLDTSDTNHYEWVANGRPWFKPSSEIVPTRIVMDRLGIDIKVARGGWNGDDWKIDDHSAFFAPQLGQAKVSANKIFMYGHNTDRVFASTMSLQSGDELKIKLDSGPWIKYRYNSAEVVDDSDIKAIHPGQDDLLLLACYGQGTNARRIMHFSLEK